MNFVNNYGVCGEMSDVDLQHLTCMRGAHRTIDWVNAASRQGTSVFFKLLFVKVLCSLDIHVHACGYTPGFPPLHPGSVSASGNKKPHNKSLSGMEKPGALAPSAGGSLSSLPISESEDEMPGT